MKRREFITALGGAAVAWPLAATAQQPALPTIGWLHGTNPDAYAPMATAFRKSLTQSGYFESQNVKIEYRWAEGRLERLPELAADLVRRRVSLIFAALRSQRYGRLWTCWHLRRAHSQGRKSG